MEQTAIAIALAIVTVTFYFAVIVGSKQAWRLLQAEVLTIAALVLYELLAGG
ncbi:hypothetical protein FBY20_1455 [Achromobacter sp. SLBN-14]|nr:hypothetical protein FBY20_1455 [Achromobacter sp. SLBN-14]